MNGRFLLDTNVVIAFFIKDESVIDRPASTDELYVSSTIIGELFYGAFNSGMVEPNCDRVEEFIRDSVRDWLNPSDGTIVANRLESMVAISRPSSSGSVIVSHRMDS